MRTSSTRLGRPISIVEHLERRQLLTTLYVDAASPGPARDGTSWSAAYADLQAALAAAASGDTIRVAGGAYKPTATADRSISFHLKTGVALYGGYAGNAAPASPDTRSPSLYPSVLSGDIGTAGTTSDNSYHVVVGSGTDASAVLDGFTVTAGNAQGPSGAVNYGGALYNDSGSPTVSNCTLTQNHAQWNGGAAYNANSSPTFLNCSFTGNTAGGGGAIMNDTGAAPLFVDCAFVGNSAAYGGAIDDNTPTSSPTFRNCTFVANASDGRGGVLEHIYSASPVFANCILWGNTAVTGKNLYLGSGRAPAVTYSDVEGGIAGTGNINADPLFVRNPSPGADGIWGGADDDYGDLRLSPASPAVDAGDNTAVPAGATLDLSGSPRFQDVPTTVDAGVGSAPVVDMGAYEAAPALAAAAGGPYAVLEGRPLTLAGRGASAVPGSLLYDWDWDADGQFDDATGPNPAFPVFAYPAGTVLTLSLRVTDADGQTAVSRTTLRIAPAVAYVDPRATAGTGDGTSWANAFTSLTDALAKSLAGQTIRVATGTYYPTATTDRRATFRVTSGVAVYGGYVGLGAPDPDVRDVAAYPTTLSGDIGAAGANSDNSYHVVTITDNADAATFAFDGFNITSGNASGTIGGASFDGGGLYVAATTAVIAHCTFTGNVARYDGGAVYSYFATPTFVDCAFTGNSANLTSGEGGAVSAYADLVTFTGCTFTNNAAGTDGGGAVYAYANASFTNCTFTGNTAGSGGGGAFYTYAGNATFTGCAFTGNSTTGSGGALYLRAAAVTITSSTFSGNTARSSGGAIDYETGGFTLSIINGTFTGNSTTGPSTANGGAVYARAGTVNLTGSAFTGNTAKGGGGGVYADSGVSVTLTTCTFTRNAAVGISSSGVGGGLYASTIGAVTNCTFDGNSAYSGGGLYAIFYAGFSPATFANCVFVGNTATSTGGGACLPSSTKIVNCTVVANSAGSTGGGISGSVSIANTILWSNTAPSGGQVSGSTTVTYSDVQGGYTGTSNQNADPRFYRNPSPGPDAKWGTADDDYGDLRLLPGSPGVDAGSNVAVPAGITTDLAGNPRTYDFPGAGTPGAATVDMGAYELTQNLGNLHVAAGQTVTLPAGGYSFSATQLTIDGGGTLDLADDALLIDYTGASPVAAVRAALSAGRNGGAWNGTGIVSSAARTTPNRGIGYAEAADLGLTTFAGQPVDATALLLKYTTAGDANLDGRINGDDYALADRGKAKGLGTWVFGDFDYDGAVTGADYAILNAAAVPPPAPAPVTVVPAAPEEVESAAPVTAATAVAEPAPVPARVAATAKPAAAHATKPAPATGKLAKHASAAKPKAKPTPAPKAKSPPLAGRAVHNASRAENSPHPVSARRQRG